MITRLNGIIIHKQPPFLTIDVGGVGYEIQVPMSTFYHLPEINQTVILLTHLIVREDAHLLYGFYHGHERELFRALIKVNGVGPKLALSILSSIDAHEFVHCVQNHDISRLVHIPGIGKKTAERLMIETRDALVQWSANHIGTPIIANEQRYIQDAVSALSALGYKPHQAQQAIKQVQQNGRNSEELIRLALQNMLPGS